MSPQPQPTQQHSRIDLADLKGQIVKRIGADQALRYFSYLGRLLSKKLGKEEFDEWCHLTLGRENLLLHNQLISSILKNACHGRAPPSISKTVPKSARCVWKRSPPREEECVSTGGISSTSSNSILPIGSYGDVLPSSPCNLKSGILDQRLRDPQTETFGSNGKAYFTSYRPRANEEALGNSSVENGNLYPCDLLRPIQHQGLAEQQEGKWDVSLPPPNETPQIKWPPHEQFHVHSDGSGEAIVVKDGEEMEQKNSANSGGGRFALQAPLGVSFYPGNIGGARMALPVTSNSSRLVASLIDCGHLTDTVTLKKRIEQIAGAAGLDGVSLDCANLLNNGLDVYLKRLIRSCIELVRARSGHELIKHSVYKQHPHGKLINGVTPSLGHQMHLQSSSGNLEVTLEPKSHYPISFLDFKLAMELKTEQLGKDWPRLLEIICLHAFEE